MSMLRTFSLSRLLSPANRYVWTPVRILYETEKAILVDTGRKCWIPKSQIGDIRLRHNTFEVYVREVLLS